MSAMATAVRALVALAVMGLASGCAVGASPPPSALPSATPALATPAPLTPAPATPAPATPTAAPSTGPSPSPTPVAYGPVSVVAGSAECDVHLGTSTKGPDGVDQARNGSVKCAMTANDPRLTGTYTAVWNGDHWGGANGDAIVQWETGRISNAGGAWEGRGSGVYATRSGDTIAYWFTGTGGYAGLSCFLLLTGGMPWDFEAQIFPGKPPTP